MKKHSARCLKQSDCAPILMTLSLSVAREIQCMRYLPRGDEEVREASDEGGGGKADRADEKKVHHVALAHVRHFAGDSRGDGVASHVFGRDSRLTAEAADVASELRGGDLHRGGGGESGHLDTRRVSDGVRAGMERCARDPGG